MTATRLEGELTKNSEHVWVYGGDHSPWVQSVLLGLHEKGIAHTVISVPPLSVFVNSGILMPAAKIDDGPWLLDSARILGKLGFSEVAESDRDALRIAFLGGAFQRTDSAWEFWYSWSHLRDGHPNLARRLWNHVWRTFSVFYFFALITLGRRQQAQRSNEQIGEDFSYWEERLATGAAFLGGDAPDTVDLQLFGQVQMYASIPGRSLAVLREDPKLGQLRDWIERMQSRFSGYAHLHSGLYFEPHLPAPQRSPGYERPFYWLGCALMWLAFPLTLAATLYLVRRVEKKGLR